MEEMDRTQITDEVFLEIARSAMQNVNEVARQERKGALAELTQLFSERIAPQIVVKRLEAEDLTLTVAFEIKLTLIYGVRIPDVVEKVRGAVKHEVEELTGCKVDRIDILVEKLVRADLPPELPIAEK
ncbi:MAG: Asp23/Gls24 family envelope stress response protein [Veillonellaceae bacterium]|nr:Asp23/Gls24 family envelope stress response protein [Veillonellaceae bacterium]